MPPGPVRAISPYRLQRAAPSPSSGELHHQGFLLDMLPFKRLNCARSRAETAYETAFAAAGHFRLTPPVDVLIQKFV
jgi:hypothetical protein